MIVRLESTTSTMRDAAELAAKGAPHGTVVAAARQTRGIGRHGHTWHSEPDGGLYMSIILRLPGHGPEVTLALGLAVQVAVSDFASTDLRWPNDVMLNHRKLAGILVQTQSGALIAGIGINVNQIAFPDDLNGVATSLRIETGLEIPMDSVLDRVLAESLRYTGKTKPEILRLFDERSTYARGKAVEVDGRYKGVTAGLDPNGFLTVRTATGIETVLAGGVREIS